MNVIWIVADTFRRDHLGCYDNQTIHTPSLDTFADKSVRFARHYMANFPTMPARDITWQTSRPCRLVPTSIPAAGQLASWGGNPCPTAR